MSRDRMHDEIAIIGMGCLFPGADSPEKYWRNLLDKKDSSTPLSRLELGVEPQLYYHPTPGTPDKICYNRNGHVRDFRFDAHGYKLGADELNSLDALFQWTLYAADQALRDSGYADPVRGGNVLQRCGLIVGNLAMPTHSGKKLMAGFYHRILEPYIQDLLDRPHFRFGEYWSTAGLSELNLMTGGQVATIAALALGLAGPSYSMDAACSSALYAIHVASYYLLSGKADLMLAGAVCHADHVYVDHGFNVLQAFPTDGRSIPFDRSSQGLKAGEGAGIVALKRYRDAIRDRDRIYGVVESIGLSNDAGAKHILVPDLNGQLLALRRAYAATSADIDYLECHATGTPVGDQVELGTVEHFFGDAPRIPLLGANKGNSGHLLTASGMASIIKVLLAMQHGVIPATLDVEELVSTPRGLLTPDNIIRETSQWPARAGARRAGVNAFGFGGVNGHMVLREHADALPGERMPPSAPERATPAPATGMAIVGIGVFLADTQTHEAFNDTILNGKQHFHDLPRTRWLGLEARRDVLAGRGVDAVPKGAYIEKFDFDCKHFRLPPKVVGSHLLSHVCLLPVAERAFADAGYAAGSERNVAVIVAGEVDFSCGRYQARNEISWQLRDSLQRSSIALPDEQSAALETIVKNSLFPEPFAEGITGGIGNVVASRIAAHLKLDGPAFSLSSHENSVFKALELAQFMLSGREVEAVIVASGSFAGSLENILWGREAAAAGSALTVGEGAGVIVLKRAQDARQSRDRIYSVVSAIEIAHESTPSSTYSPSADSVARVAVSCLSAGGVEADNIDYIECYASALAGEGRAEADGLARVYATAARAAPVTIGSAKANYGHLSAAAGIVSLIKTSLCLFHRYLPAAPPFEGLDGVAAGVFATQAQSQPWPEPHGGLRRAAISSLGVDRAYAHLILEESRQEDRQAVEQRPRRTSGDAGSLLTTVYAGREKTLAEIILDDANRAIFGTAVRTFPADAAAAGAAAPATGLLDRQLLRNARTQLRYLQVEQSFYRRMTDLLSSLGDGAPAPRQLVFNESQLVELTDGSLVNVLGPDYAEADSYRIRTRMPSPPYLFVSRITALSARKGALEPCFIEWEYDLPEDAWYVCDGRVPAFVALESSHAMIVAFTCIGCDQLFKGELRYRAVDSQTTIYGEMPRAGEVLRGRVDIKSFIKAGRNILISYEYLCYAGRRLVFKLVASSGFFLAKDLERSKGVDAAAFLKNARPARPFHPPLRSTKPTFDHADIEALQRGDLERCFGPAHRTAASHRLAAVQARMLDRVISVDPHAGPFGLGVVVAERDIDPAHWVFQAHFKNDPVMPGTFLVEGCEQLVKFYLGYLGLYSQPGLIPHTLTDHAYSAKFRGEVKCEAQTVRYRLTCKSIQSEYAEDGVTLDRVRLVFLAEILYRGNVIGICDNLGAGFVRHAAAALPRRETQAALAIGELT